MELDGLVENMDSSEAANVDSRKMHLIDFRWTYYLFIEIL